MSGCCCSHVSQQLGGNSNLDFFGKVLPKSHLDQFTNTAAKPVNCIFKLANCLPRLGPWWLDVIVICKIWTMKQSRLNLPVISRVLGPILLDQPQPCLATVHFHFVIPVVAHVEIDFESLFPCSVLLRGIPKCGCTMMNKIHFLLGDLGVTPNMPMAKIFFQSSWKFLKQG